MAKTEKFLSYIKEVWESQYKAGGVVSRCHQKPVSVYPIASLLKM